MQLKELEITARVIIYSFIFYLGTNYSNTDDAGLLFLWLVCWDFTVFITTVVPKFFTWIGDVVKK
jgi:hypothetical protein